MTGISGAVIDLAAVTAMFTRIQGQRQGAPIETAEYQCVSLTENTISVRYQETQHFAGSTTARRSLVILRRRITGSGGGIIYMKHRCLPEMPPAVFSAGKCGRKSCFYKIKIR